MVRAIHLSARAISHEGGACMMCHDISCEILGRQMLWSAALRVFPPMASEASSLIWTAAPPKRGALAFASLFAVESFARALISTVVSVQAHDLLQSSQKVSVLFTCVSLAVLASTLTLAAHLPLCAAPLDLYRGSDRPQSCLACLRHRYTARTGRRHVFAQCWRGHSQYCACPLYP